MNVSDGEPCRELRPAALMDQQRGLPDRWPRLRGVGERRGAVLLNEHLCRPSPVALFFITGPGTLHPVLYRDQVLLPGLMGGPLAGVVVALEQPADRVLLVAVSSLRLCDFEEARDDPEDGGEPVRRRCASPRLRRLNQPLVTHAGGTAESRDGSMGPGSAFLKGTIPLVNGHPKNVEPSGDLRLGNPRAEPMALKRCFARVAVSRCCWSLRAMPREQPCPDINSFIQRSVAASAPAGELNKMRNPV